MIPGGCGATVTVEDRDVQFVETWGYRKKESTGAVGDTRGWLVICLVLFMQRGGDLPLLANRALVGHRCRCGARQVSLALINRQRWLGFRNGSLQDSLERKYVLKLWSVKPIVRDTVEKFVVPICYLVASAESYRGGIECLGLAEGLSSSEIGNRVGKGSAL